MKKYIGTLSLLMAIMLLLSSCKTDSVSSADSISQKEQESKSIHIFSNQNILVGSSHINDDTELSYDEEKTVEQINIILSRYSSGEYPSPLFYYGNTHSTHIPEGIVLPLVTYKK